MTVMPKYKIIITKRANVQAIHSLYHLFCENHRAIKHRHFGDTSLRNGRGPIPDGIEYSIGEITLVFILALKGYTAVPFNNCIFEPYFSDELCHCDTPGDGYFMGF